MMEDTSSNAIEPAKLVEYEHDSSLEPGEVVTPPPRRGFETPLPNERAFDVAKRQQNAEQLNAKSQQDAVSKRKPEAEKLKTKSQLETVETILEIDAKRRRDDIDKLKLPPRSNYAANKRSTRDVRTIAKNFNRGSSTVENDCRMDDNRFLRNVRHGFIHRKRFGRQQFQNYKQRNFYQPKQYFGTRHEYNDANPDKNSLNAEAELKWTRTLPSLSYAFNNTGSTTLKRDNTNSLRIRNKNSDDEKKCEKDHLKNNNKSKSNSKTETEKTTSIFSESSFKHRNTTSSSDKKPLQAGIDYMFKQSASQKEEKEERLSRKWRSENKNEHKIKQSPNKAAKDQPANNIETKHNLEQEKTKQKQFGRIQSEKEGNVKPKSKLPSPTSKKYSSNHRNLSRDIKNPNEIDCNKDSESSDLASKLKSSEFVASAENIQLKEELIVPKFEKVSNTDITEKCKSLSTVNTKAHIETNEVQEKKECKLDDLIPKRKDKLLCQDTTGFKFDSELFNVKEEIESIFDETDGKFKDLHEFTIPQTEKLQKTRQTLTPISANSKIQPYFLSTATAATTSNAKLVMSSQLMEILPTNQRLLTPNMQRVKIEKISASFKMLPASPTSAAASASPPSTKPTKVQSEKKAHNANDFDVLSMSEMRAQEAAEQQAKLIQQQLKEVPEHIFNKSTVTPKKQQDDDESEKSLKELLPDVSKDFKKLKTVENNLQQIQKMLVSFNDIDDICDELSKMEKLFLQEKNLILQKYAKSAGALLPKSIKKSKKLKINTTESPTASTLPAESLSTTSQTTTLSAGDENILNSSRQAIKIKISPIKLANKNVSMQLVKRAVMHKLFDDEDDDDEVYDKNAKKNAEKKSMGSPTTVSEQAQKQKDLKTINKGVAIVKPMMESPHSTNRERSCQRSSRSATSGSRTDSRRSFSRSLTRSPIRRPGTRPSRLTNARRYRQSLSPIGSYSRFGRYRRSTTPYNQRRSILKTSRTRSPFARIRERAGSISPRPRRPRTPLCTPPPPADTINYNKRNRIRSPVLLNYRRRSYSNSPLPFKPPSPPAVSRSLSPHSSRCSRSRSHSRSRSWTPDRRKSYRARSPFSPRRGRGPFSPRRRHSSVSPRRVFSPLSPRRARLPVSSTNYRSILYADLEPPDVEDYDELYFPQQRDSYAQESVQYVTPTDSYYYNMAPHIQMIPAETPHYARPIPLSAEHNYDNYTPENYHGTRYSQTDANESVYAHIPALRGVSANEINPLPSMTSSKVIQPSSGTFPPYSTAPSSFVKTMMKQQQTMAKETPKAMVAVQKGNVLEIVPMQENNKELCSESNANGKEITNKNIHVSTAALNSTPTATVLPVMSSAVTEPVLLPPTALKKTIDMKWKEEVEQRKIQANIMRQQRSKKSILKSDKEQNKEEVVEKSKGVKPKKKVFFADGIYPSHDSGDEDRKAVAEVLARKVRRLRRRYTDDQIKVARFLSEELEADIDPGLENLPPPPPPPGIPPKHLEQPEYLRPLSPDTYVFFHYDPVVSSMYVSAHEHALPPRLLDPKKTAPPTGAVAELMNSFMPPRKPSIIKPLSLPSSNDINIQSLAPTSVSSLIVPSMSAAPTVLSAIPPRAGARLPTRHTTARNEFVTQPLYPSSTQFKPALPPPLPTLRLPPPTHIAPLLMKPPPYGNPIAAVPATARNNKGVPKTPYNDNNLLEVPK